MFFLDFVIPFVAHCRQEMDMCFCFVCIGDREPVGFSANQDLII